MADEVFANDAVGALSANIDSSQILISLISAALFPTNGDFRIRIDNEYMKVTEVDVNLFTVERGTEFSASASHLSGAQVYQVVTKEALENWRKYTNFWGSESERPTTPFAKGRTFWPNNRITIAVDDASFWRPYGPIFYLPFEPHFFNANWINQGTADDSYDDTAYEMFSPNTDLTGKTFTITITGGYTIKALILPNPVPSGTWEMGIMHRDSTNNKLKTFGFKSGRKITIGKWTNYNNFNSTDLEIDQHAWPLWLQIENTGSDLLYSVSTDNIRYQQILSQNNTTFSGNDEWGLYIVSTNTFNNAMRLLSNSIIDNGGGGGGG